MIRIPQQMLDDCVMDFGDVIRMLSDQSPPAPYIEPEPDPVFEDDDISDARLALIVRDARKAENDDCGCMGSSLSSLAGDVEWLVDRVKRLRDRTP